MISLRPSPGDSAQVARAIGLAAIIGSRIQADFPEVVDDYRAGRTTAQIAEDRNIIEHYGLSPKTARNAIGYALGGYQGSERIEPYRGLIPSRKEREKLAKKHRSANAERLDMQMQREKRGAYGLDAEARRRLSRLGLQAQIKRGTLATFSDMSAEKHAATCRTGVIAAGQVPWREREQNETVGRYGEVEYAERLSELPVLRYSQGTYAGRPRWEFVASLVNEVYHRGKPIRTANSTQIAVSNAKKRSKRT